MMKMMSIETITIDPDLDGCVINEIIRRNKGKKISFQVDSSSTIESMGAENTQFLSDIDMSGINENDSVEDINKSQNSPIVGLVNNIFHEAVNLGASDIHFEPKENGIKIRMRVNGSLVEIMDINKKISKFINARIKVLSKLNVSEKRKSQDGKVLILVDGKKLDLRISFIPNAYGERCVVRVLIRESLKNILSKHSNTEEFKKILKIANKKHGLLLVCGPTGSGKSTTMYGIVNGMKDKNINILTIEDPIEYNIEGIGQTQVDEENGVSFSTGLRAILRQDPDMIMVGEIRDLDTAKIAIQSSLTGHMVYSTLHANTSIGAIFRLKDLGVDPYLISTSLTGVVSQRLVRVLCSCANESDVEIKLHNHKITEKKIAKGCSECNYSGYIGRQAVYGVLKMNDAASEAIHDGVGEAELKRVMGDDGMVGGLVRMVNDGLTDINELKLVLGDE
jgi:general secretion pathway protein E